MRDNRIEKLAKNLLMYSVKLQKSENILIEVNNEINEQGYVKWKRNNVQDEYCITYHYPKEVLEKIRSRK